MSCLLLRYTTHSAYIHFKHVQAELKFTFLVSVVFRPNELFFQTKKNTQMNNMVPLSNQLKIKKIVQFVAKILGNVTNLVCKIWIFLELCKYDMTHSAYIHFKHVQTVFKFTLLVSAVFHTNKLFFQSKKYTLMNHMFPLPNYLKIKNIVMFVAEILGNVTNLVCKMCIYLMHT